MLRYSKLQVLFFFVFVKLLHVGAVPAFTINNTKTYRIVGGYRCRIIIHAYMVAILRPLDGNLVHHCGGTILSEYWVLTAAQCITEYKPETLTVIAGAAVANIKSNSNWNMQTSEVKMGFPYDNNTLVNDIALLLLKSPIHFFINVRYVQLATSKDVEVKTACKDGLTMGWGIQYPRNEKGKPLYDRIPKYDPYLQCLNTKFLPYKECRKKLGPQLSNRSFCAYTRNKDSCLVNSTQSI